MAHNVPVIFCTSKTLSEIGELNRSLENPHPIVGENGGVMAWSGDYPFAPPFTSGYREVITQQIFEPDYDSIQNTLHALKGEYKFQGLQDFSVESLAGLTGLDPAEAEAARRRQVTEPLLWKDSNDKLELFRQKLTAAGLQLIQGGRFYHVQGPFTKGRALEYLTDCYAKALGARPQTVALGDSQNDLPMLEACDYPVVIKRRGSHQINPRHKSVYATDNEGPAGWAEGIAQTPLGAEVSA